jgi:hypothetical protein
LLAGFNTFLTAPRLPRASGLLGIKPLRTNKKVNAAVAHLQGQRTMISNSLWEKELVYTHFSGLKS